MADNNEQVFLTGLLESVKETLTKRQENIASRDQKSWYYDRKPWVRFTSMSSVNGDRELRKKWILFGGIQTGNNYASGYNEMYNIPKDRFNSIPEPDLNLTRNIPIPGITNVKIESKDTAGSLREATVSFTCWNLQQLDVLENLFMVPGVSCLLEWGWNVDIDGRPIEIDLSQLEPKSDYCIHQLIQKRIILTNGHYDAMQGPVGGFNFSLRPDGGFDCTTTITSMGSSFINASLGNKSKNIRAKNVSGESRTMVETNIMGSFWQAYNSIEKYNKKAIRKVEDNRAQYTRKDIINDPNNNPALVNLGTLFLDKEDDNSEWWSESQVTASGAQFFTTWDYFENYIINSNFSLTNGNVSRGNATTNIVQKSLLDQGLVGQMMDWFSKVDDCPDIKQLNNTSILPYLDSSKVWINYTKFILSGDPYICILPDFDIVDIPQTRSVIKNSDALVRNIQNLKPFQIDFFNEDKTKIKLSKILINFKFLYECIKSSTTLSELIYKVANGISDACGGLWKFQLIEDPVKKSKMMLVDLNTMNEMTPPFTFKVYDINSIVRNVTLQSESDPDIRTMSMYSTPRKSTKQNKDGSQGPTDMQKNMPDKSDTIIYNMYGKDIIDLSKGHLRPLYANEAGDDTDTPPDEQPQAELSIGDYLLDMFNLYKEIYFEKRTPDNSQSCCNAIKKYLTEVNMIGDNIQQHLKYPLTPITLTVDIDGIGGIIFGNTFDLDYKPARYKYSKFLAKRISHEITPNDWTTNIETQMVLNYIEFSGKNNVSNIYDGSISVPSPQSYGVARIPAPLKLARHELLGYLHPNIRRDAIRFINEVENKLGYKIHVTNTWRSFEQQDNFYRYGRDENGNIVNKSAVITYATAGKSFHQYGLAMDICGNGWKYDKSKFKQIAEIGKEYGFDWGGEFTKFNDWPHFQKPLGYTVHQLLAKHNNDEYDETGYLIL